MNVTKKLWSDEAEALVDVELPGHYEVCWRCSGKGTHVNPSVDGNGLSREDFDADPDFEEAYFAGHYDVVCYECKGRRVMPVTDVSLCTYAQKRLLVQHRHYEQEMHELRQMEQMERRAGA